MDISGRTVYQSGTSGETINTVNWPAGIYFVQVSQNGLTYHAKWIKMK